MKLKKFIMGTGSMMAFTGFRPLPPSSAPVSIHPLDRFNPRIRNLILSACQHMPTKSPINCDGVRIVRAQLKSDRKAQILRQSQGIQHAA